MARIVKRFILFFPLLLILGGEAIQIKSLRGEDLRVNAVKSAVELVLSNGETVRLAGLWFEAEMAQKNHPLQMYLEEYFARDPVLRVSKAGKTDRFGRRPVIVLTQTGDILQEDLLKQGLARVFTYGGFPNRADLVRFYAAEAGARDQKIGQWGTVKGLVRSVHDPHMPRDEFALVEGRVYGVNRIKDVIYVNFAPDWRRDFTVKMPADWLEQHPEVIRRLDRFKGKRLRIRGWVFDENGPMMAPESPQQIEFLEE